jgi:AraC family transcriptional regulator
MHNNVPTSLAGSAAQPDIELDQLFSGPSLCRATSRGLRWIDFLLEEHTVGAGEQNESNPPYATLFMWRCAAGTGELKADSGRLKPYALSPGSLGLFPADLLPAVRTFTRSQFVVFAIRRTFLENLKIERDRMPAEEIRALTGFQDSELHQLMTLLFAEVNRGGIFGRLYADSLAQAIAARLLYFNERDRESSRCEASPLPRRILQRVIERMQDLDAGLNLRTLAAETGYSQRHFIRMFRAATGQTPHRFVVQLRLEHAKRLLRQHRASLIDVAAEAGFSSHAHMTQVFRRVLGVTPSEFRKAL